MTNTRPPVAPVEGAYAMLRNGIVEKIGEQKPTLDGYLMFHAVNFNYLWHDTGKSYWDNGQYDIIAIITPEAMQAAASGEVERLQTAIRDIIEIYAGSEWFKLQTAPEAYLKNLIKQMVEFAALKEETP